MPILNHFGISNLYFSSENKKSVHLFYAHNCVVFMDGLNVVAWCKNFASIFSGPAELLGRTTKFHDSSFDSYGGSD